jgi:plastocyanin
VSHPIGTRSRLRTARGPVAALALALGLLSACGGDEGGSDDTAATTTSTSTETTTESSSAASESSDAGSGEVETITATEADFSITLDGDTLPAGDYEIEVVNGGDATHDLVVERDGEDVVGTDTIAPGESATLTVTLEAGEYVFYCSIGNHRAMGMEVTVQVGS